MYKLNEEKMFYDYADGQAVVINYQTGMYYGMSLLGSAILDRIVAGKDVGEIIKAVKALPQCPSDIAERVQGFVKELLETLDSYMEEGPMYFPEDMITDHPERFIVSEIIREKLLTYLSDDVPHGVAVEIESYEEEDELTRIGAVIYCEKKSHKGMIIGKGGRKLKGIGKSARQELEALVGTKVFLQTWVKVRENWRDSDRALSQFGYGE